MAGLRRFQHDFDGFAVAHFSDKNDFWSLTHGRAQSMSKTRRVAVQFPLMNGRALVIVQELDGIFDRDEVRNLCRVDPIEQRGQGRRLSCAPRPGNQHNAIAETGHLRQLFRQAE